MWRPGIRQWMRKNPGDILFCSFSLFIHVLLEIHLYCQLLQQYEKNLTVHQLLSQSANNLHFNDDQKKILTSCTF